MRQKRIEVNGKEIAYYETRDNGSPVVLVHGLSSCSSVFIRQLIDSVLSYQFRFIAVDLIGFGNSDKSDNPEKDYTIQGLSRFLNNFCTKLEIKNAVYMGHDIGGNVIIESFDQLNNPKGLVLLSSIPFSLPFHKGSFTQDEIFKLLSKAGIDSSEVHQTASLFVDEGVNYPDFIPEIIRKADSKTREIFFKSVSEGQYNDQLNILKNINIPVAIYYGESDQMINTEYFKNFTIPALWRDKTQKVKDAGHMFFYESPADFNISIETFLNTVFN
jgi:pimeloyl-ACP methyl ester carboxylesterase